METNQSLRIQQIYALIFVSGEEGVTIAQIRAATQLPNDAIYLSLDQLVQHLAQDPVCPYDLVSYNERYQLVTKAHLAPIVEDYALSSFNQKLTRAAIETLAIIAYHQPVTRIQVDEIRGVSSQAMLQKLLAHDLIQELGRVEAPGRPLLYGVTDYFMQYFGLESLEELPELSPINLHTQATADPLFKLKTWSMADVMVTDESENAEEKAD